MTIARQSAEVKNPEDATILRNQVEMFLHPGEEKQHERVRYISTLAVKLYGKTIMQGGF